MYLCAFLYFLLLFVFQYVRTLSTKDIFVNCIYIYLSISNYIYIYIYIYTLIYPSMYMLYKYVFTKTSTMFTTGYKDNIHEE